jgi:hypothetical protein
MEFLKYQHVQRFGNVEVEGIEFGKCYIFPKIDGTNASLWWCDNQRLCGGSRNRTLDIGNDNAGFYNWALSDDKICNFFKKYPHLRLYGEWLVPHTLKTYKEDAWRRFYVFDVMDGDRYLSYEEYQPLMEEFGIDYIPPIIIIENPTYERLIHQLTNTGFMVKDGDGDGEGIVIKRYDFVNKFGKTIWAKIVSTEFKERHCKTMGAPETKEKKMVEQDIANEYVTLTLIEKEYAKIVNDTGGWNSKMIPRLLNTVYYCIVMEELWNALKKFKNPTINFKTLQHFVFSKVKEVNPKLF